MSVVGIGLVIAVFILLAILYTVASVVGLILDGIYGKMPKWLAFPTAAIIIAGVTLIACGVVK